MSEYFRILNRVEEEHADSDLNKGSKPLLEGTEAAPKQAKADKPSHAERKSASRADAKPVDKRPVAPRVQAPPRKTRTAAHSATDRNASFARAFDNLRAIAADSGLSRIVIAGASASEDVDSVITGLAAQAEHHQLTAVFSELGEAGGRYRLSERARFTAGSDDSNGNAARPEPAVFRITSGAAPAEFDQWIDQTLKSADLVMIKAPGLGQTVDAALLARNTDGIVVVVESAVTTKEDLKLAVERVRSVGCRVLGLIASGTDDEVPAWVKQITG